MKRYLLLLPPLLTSLLLLAHNAQAQTVDASQEVYLCVDEKGHREYKNTGAVKGCKKVELPGITTIAAPPKRAASAGGGNKAPAASTPSDFPKVDSTAQKARDNDRKQILQDELKAEETKLANLKKDYHGGEPERRGDEANYAKYQDRVSQMKDDIARVDKNIEALRRELSNLK